MVPDLIWAPDFFGPKEIWAPHKNNYMAFLWVSRTIPLMVKNGKQNNTVIGFQAMKLTFEVNKISIKRFFLRTKRTLQSAYVDGCEIKS